MNFRYFYTKQEQQSYLANYKFTIIASFFGESTDFDISTLCGTHALNKRIHSRKQRNQLIQRKKSHVHMRVKVLFYY